MKAIVEKGISYKITGERGDFFIVEDNKGKGKMFCKKDVEVIEIESLPKVKIYKKYIASAADLADSKYQKQQLQDAKYSRGIYKNQ